MKQTSRHQPTTGKRHCRLEAGVTVTVSGFRLP